MRNIYICLVFAIFSSVSLKAQHSCCAPASAASSTQKFAAFASDVKFGAAHETPKPLALDSLRGEMVTFATVSGEGRAYFLKTPKASSKVVFVFHEYWGLNDYIKREAQRIQKDLGDVTVYAIDLYDGKIATTAEDAGKFMQAVKEDRARAIIEGAIAKAGSEAKIATIGWCFGGGWALQAAIMAGSQTQGCIIYYGMPETDVAVLKTLQAPVVGHFASKDAWITPAIVADFKKNMKAAGKKLTVHMYNADHAFANPSNPKYNKSLSAQAYKKSIAFFKEVFKRKRPVPAKKK
ncbi:MAG: dienelactone hydrolase family protein [Bacteroidota bacterium]